MLKWYVLFIVVLINFISSASAITEKNFVEEVEKSTELTRYGKIEIYEKPWYDYFNWFDLREKVKEINLKNNTEKCINCFAEGEITLLKDDILIEDVLFKRSFDNSWVDWNAYKNWKIYIENKERYKEVPVYETICGEEKFNEETKNYTQKCEQVEVGKETIDTGEWVELSLGSVYPAGTYKWRLEGSKKPSVMYDWQLKTSGIILNEWAVWGNISQGAEAEVNLISPPNNEVVYTNQVDMVSSANVTNGAYLVNATLYTNETGSWEEREVKDILIDSSGLVSYYTFDETSGTTAYDIINSNNLIHQNGVVVGQQGKISLSPYYNGVDHYSFSSFRFDTNRDVSNCFWLNTTSNSAGQYSILKQRTPDTSNAWWEIFQDGGNVGFSSNHNGVIFSNPNTNNVWNFYCITLKFNTKNFTWYRNGNVLNTQIASSWGGLNGFSYENGLYIMGHPYLGWQGDGAGYVQGKIDELSIWYRTLTQQEIQRLYNSGAGSRLNSTSTTVPITFTKSYPAGSNILWNVKYCDTDGDCGFALENRSFSIDNIAPNITLNYPTSLLDYRGLNQTLTINITATDINLDKVWYNYNGTNITISGAVSGVWNVFNITLTTKKNITIWANDTLGNLESKLINWDYKVFENSRTFTQSTFETKTETYSINLTANSSLTEVKLNWNGTNYTMNKVGSVWSYTRDMPIGIGNFDFNFLFTYSNSTIVSNNSTQQVNLTLFTPLNATYNIPFLNITFKDENSLASINASIPTSTFVYYLGSGSVNKTLTYVNNANSFNHTFAGTTGGLPLYVLPEVQYRRVNDYPQRIWQPTLKIYNSTLTTQVLYLLDVNDGIFVTYQVVNPAGQPIQGVDVTISRVISGETVVIGVGQTDSAGLVTFWVNPDFVHKVTFKKSGYKDFDIDHFPTQSSYTITLTQSSGEIDDFTYGVYYSAQPKAGTTLEANTNVNFSFVINSTYWNLTSFQFSLYDQDNNLIGGNISTGKNYGVIINIINVSNASEILMIASWRINSTDTKVSFTWKVRDSSLSSWSIKTFFSDLSLYANQGMLGLTSLSLSLIIFLVIFLITGILSYKFGLTSPAVIFGIIFVLVYFFDVGLGLIPSPLGGVKHFVTIFFSLIMIAIIIKEVTT